MDEITAKVEGKTLVIRMPLNGKPEPSKSGKNLVVASTRGNLRTSTQVDGKPLIIGVNAYIQA